MNKSTLKTLKVIKSNLLAVRDVASKYFGQYQRIAMLVIKFVAYYIVFGIISGLDIYEAGGVINSGIVRLALSVVCAFLPGYISTLAVLGVFAYNLISASMVGGALFSLFLLIVYIVTVRFTPEYTYFLIVMPIVLKFGWYMLVPMLAGLFIGAIGIVPVMCGTFMWGLIRVASSFLTLNAEIDFKDMSSLAELPAVLVEALEGSLANFDFTTIIMTMIALGLVALAVGVVFKFKVKYVHYISLIAGMVVGIIGLSFAAKEGGLDLSTGRIFKDGILSLIIAALCKVIIIPLEYQAIQNINFSDDDYFYQVRIIPKANSGQSASEEIGAFARMLREKEEKNKEKASSKSAREKKKQQRRDYDEEDYEDTGFSVDTEHTRAWKSALAEQQSEAKKERAAAESAVKREKTTAEPVVKEEKAAGVPATDKAEPVNAAAEPVKRKPATVYINNKRVDPVRTEEAKRKALEDRDTEATDLFAGM